MNDERTNLLLYPDSVAQDKSIKENKISEVTTDAFLYDAIYEETANDIHSKDKPELITLMGLPSCGKTTFVGSLYILLKTRPNILGVSFLDSDTLTGFEKKVYLRRIKENQKSAVKRTLRSEGSILNIVVSDDNNDKRMLLISDKAGESYGDVLNKSDEANKHLTVKYANKLLLFIDSEQIINHYNSYKDNIKTLLTVFRNADMLPEDKKVIIVFNKIDKKDSDENAKKNWNEREKSLVEIVDEFFNVDNSVFRINSLGIKHDEEDEELIRLYKKILAPNDVHSLPNDYNWITKQLKESVK